VSAGEDDEGPPVPASPVEWAAACVGAAMLLGVVGYLVQHEFARPKGPPALAVQATGTLAQGDGFLVGFLVRNDGDATAAQVTVRGTLRRGEATVEESDVVLDYVPERSQRRGGLYFRADPARHELVLRPLGYAEP